ncbi:MAG TPA: tocopherol cyclase family protein [Ruminiclostridium sp.]|nr:tocopherol cyclase family protein [Ruminiclostridium sp.]
MYLINKILNPEMYQGKYRHRKYFEGWYFKVIDKNSRNIFAIIPGVSKTKKDTHSFIQLIDAVSGNTSYVRFPIQEFRYSLNKFDIFIDKNHFDRNGFFIDIKSDGVNISGDIRYTDIVPFPKSFLNPGIMGPYSFVPFMECYHGIVNIHCGIEGFLNINDRVADFSGGYGYLEKDWGTSFPKSWIWLQSNHFKTPNASVMFSIASIPWLGSSFDGLITFLKLGNRFYRFASYTGAKVKRLSCENNVLSVILEDSNYTLSLRTTAGGGGILKAPKKGGMSENITESITSVVDVVLSEKDGNVIFDETGENTGLELAGDYMRFERK